MINYSRHNEWYGWIKIILIAIICAFLIRTFLFSTSIVDGNSMAPTLQDGERVMINKFSYIMSDPKRGDIAIIEHGDKNYVKRIIGLPNETIQMKNYTLYINEKALPTSFVSRDKEILTGDFGPIDIPDDHYFVMGDNRPLSLDSRHELGFIHRSELAGKSSFVIFPLNHMKITH